MDIPGAAGTTGTCNSVSGKSITLQGKLEENDIAYFPFEDMAITYQFCIEDNERSYRRDVTREWLNRQG